MTIPKDHPAVEQTSFRKELERRRDEAHKRQNHLAMLGHDGEAAVEEGRVLELEWVLEQDPVVLSDADREELRRIADIIGGVHRPCADPELHEDDARFLRKLASGQGER